jgi:IclR family transcriptional regulator, KDG regulon repressor
VKAEKASGRIQSLVRAFTILETIAGHPSGIGLSDLSGKVGLHNSTVYHLVKTMVSMGYVAQAEDSRYFSIGGRFFHLASSALNETRLLNIVNPYVRRLARETETTCQFAVRSGDRAAVLVKGEGGDIFHSAEQVGASRPSHCTSHGKIILSGASDEELDEFLRTHKLDRMTPHTIIGPDQLRAEIELIRKRGIAYDDAEFHPELRCVAAPVRDFAGRVIGSLGIAGPIWRLSLQALEAKAQAVRKAADALSRELGYSDKAAAVDVVAAGPFKASDKPGKRTRATKPGAERAGRRKRVLQKADANLV